MNSSMLANLQSGSGLHGGQNCVDSTLQPLGLGRQPNGLSSGASPGEGVEPKQTEPTLSDLPDASAEALLAESHELLMKTTERCRQLEAKLAAEKVQRMRIVESFHHSADVDVLNGFVHRLEENLRKVQADQHSERIRQEIRIWDLYSQILDHHRLIGCPLSDDQFENLLSLWREYVAAVDKEPTGPRADHNMSGSKWDQPLFQKYADYFHVLDWDVDREASAGGRRDRRHMLDSTQSQGLLRTDLEAFHLAEFTGVGPSNMPVGSAVSFQDLNKFLVDSVSTGVPVGNYTPGSNPLDDDLLTIARNMACNLGALGVGIPSADRCSPEREVSQTFAKLGRLNEASSRVIVDSILLPLCRRTGLSVKLEEKLASVYRPSGAHLPANICDYVLRPVRQTQPIGAVEVKRCEFEPGSWKKILGQGVVQSLLQLLAIRGATQEKCGETRSLIGFVTDGRRWIRIELHREHIGISPVLDLGADDGHQQFEQLANVMESSFRKFVLL